MTEGEQIDIPFESSRDFTEKSDLLKREQSSNLIRSSPTSVMASSGRSITSVSGGRTATMHFMTTLRGRPLTINPASSFSCRSPPLRRAGKSRRGLRHRLPLTPGGVQSFDDSSDDSLHDSDSESEDETLIATVDANTEEVEAEDSSGDEESDDDIVLQRDKRAMEDLMDDEDATDDECEDVEEDEDEDDSDDEDEKQLVRAFGHNETCSHTQSPVKKLKRNNGEPSARYTSEDCQERAVTEESEEEEEVEERRVRFTSVSIRECPVVEGDHPCCKCGPALQLGWFVSRDIRDISIDQFEAMRKPRGESEIDDDCSDSDDSDSESETVESMASVCSKKMKRLPRRNHRRELRMSAAIRRRWLQRHEHDLAGSDTDSDDSSDEEEELSAEAAPSPSPTQSGAEVEKPFDYLEAEINVEDSDDDLDDGANNINSNSFMFRATSPHNGMCPPSVHRQLGGKQLVRVSF